MNRRKTWGVNWGVNWDKVRLIFFREMRDQLRDRRTLFMIAVLPVLLYPLMGMTFLQIAQFLQEHPTRVAVVGADGLPAEPRLLDDERGQFEARLFSSPDRAHLLEVESLPLPADVGALGAWAQQELNRGDFDALIYIPPQFAEHMSRHTGQLGVTERGTPRPQVFFNGAKDRSRVAYERVVTVLDRWRAELVQQTLEARDVPAGAAEPFVIGDQDVAELSSQRAALWSKVLPFVLILWALTGAFYPAIDLCAGEKERGTLETLLCSPAERQEIVWGKLLTVSGFSMATALLNLISLTTTGALIMTRMQLPGSAGISSFGPPPLSVMVWLVLALIPLAAMFSALSLALATMARSTKEGQYYLMPLMLITMPLSMIAIIPTTELSFGNSLIPVTGVMLLLRALIEGDYFTALQFVLPVSVVTGLCCLLAIRWAVHLFNDESVLFRESERFSLGIWLRHLVRDRGVTPSLAEGFMCGVIILMLQFFARLMAPAPHTWSDFLVSTLVVQIALVATPAILMTLMLTASASRTLLLRPTRFISLVAAVLLAVFLNPAATAMRDLVQVLYPISPETFQLLAELSAVMKDVPLWQVMALMAVAPAICEELAFRGFILSGLRHIGNKGMAILISSLFFGIVHGILQQSISACVLGLVLGYIAVQTGSILPCMLFHVTHNALQILSSATFTAEFLVEHPAMRIFFTESPSLPGALSYRIPFVVVSILASGLLLRWFRSLPFSPTPEERLQDALDHQASPA
jgi:sodium transport system permease protein